MNLDKINKDYVSDIDKFLTEFDGQHEKSESQKEEIKKHEHIAKLRDHSDSDKTS